MLYVKSCFNLRYKFAKFQKINRKQSKSSHLYKAINFLSDLTQKKDQKKAKKFTRKYLEKAKENDRKVGEGYLNAFGSNFPAKNHLRFDFFDEPVAR